MKFLRTTTEEKHTGGGGVSKYDNIGDPVVLSHQLLNTKKSFRYKKYTHVRISEVHSFCPREYAIGYLTDTAQENYVDFPLQQQFDLGSAIHYWVQNGHSKVFKDVICGTWKCLGCRNKRKNKDGSIYFGTKPKTNCETCGAFPEATVYDEFMFRIDKPYRIVGKMDEILFKDGVYRIGDFKSYWQRPKSGFPIGKDVVQLSSYMYFYSLLPDELKFPVNVDTTCGYLHYISKKFSFTESILTYPIRPNKKMLEPIIRNVGAFTNAANIRKLPPPLSVCLRSEFKKGRAKDCYMADKCKEYYYNGITKC